MGSAYIRLGGGSVAAMAIFSASPLAAQATDRDEENILVLGAREHTLTQESPTASRLGMTALETPASINTISGDEFRARGDFAFIDAVTRAPGVTVGEFTLERQMEVVRKLRGQGYADGTIKRAMGAVKAAVNFAWKNGELDRPVPFGTLPEGQPRERVLSIEELAALWDATEPPHLQMFVMLLLGTAARPEAILQLTRFPVRHGARDH